MRTQDTVLIVLAAGLSRRFGQADKLLADMGGHPLATHIIAAVASIDFQQRLAVVSNGLVKGLFLDAGYEIVENAIAEQGQATSIAMGVLRALNSAPKAICIALADMPFVPEQHFQALIEGCDNHDIMMSQCGGQYMPPAVFSGQYIDPLTQLSGDRGALASIDPGVIRSRVLKKRFARDIDLPQDI